MKITPFFVTLVLVIIISMQAHSQKFYLGIGGGYGMPTAPAMQGTYNATIVQFNNTNSVITDYSLSNSSVSYGKGLQACITAGKMVNENIYAELGISYLSGAKFTSKTLNISQYNDSSTETFVQSATMLRLIPSVIFTVGKTKIKPYAKLGLVIGFGTKITLNSTSVSPSITSQQKNISLQKEETTGGIPLGYTAALGATYQFNNRFSLFAEINVITQSWSPSKKTIKSYIVNGVDKTSGLSQFDRETNYVNGYSYSDPNYPNNPNRALKTHYPFSSIGLNVGLHFSLHS